MEVVILADATEVAAYVAGEIQSVIEGNPTAVLGLATGSTPIAMYAELVRRHRAGIVGFSGCTVFMLDEYIGLPPDHPQSYRTFIDAHFAALVDIDPLNVHVPDTSVAGEAIVEECAAYENAIVAAGGVDLQLLGIGADGHLGFNEPSSSLASRTRVKTLTSATRRDNARFFDSPDAVPRHVVTQGIGTILEARRLVLVATGAAKARPIAHAVEGPLSAMCPASALQLHRTATIVIDESAASELALADYYRETFAGKPAWQRPGRPVH